MRIYLAQYNTIRTIGEWVELPCTKEDLHDIMSRVDEECFITDSEEMPFEVGEYDDPYELNEKLEQYRELDEHKQLCVTFLSSEGYDWAYCMDHHEDVIMYPQESLEDVAYALAEDGCFGTIPENLSNYIDYSAIARDLGYDGYVERDEGVFCHGG